jgi:hypothetical protein
MRPPRPHAPASPPVHIGRSVAADLAASTREFGASSVGSSSRTAMPHHGESGPGEDRSPFRSPLAGTALRVGSFNFASTPVRSPPGDGLCCLGVCRRSFWGRFEYIAASAATMGEVSCHEDGHKGKGS